MGGIAIVGAGLSGAVIANQLGAQGLKVSVFEGRGHVGGNCHTSRDLQTGVMMHVYGPHIFHTDNKRVWDFISSFGEMVPYTNRVKAVVKNKVYGLPINLLTINQFYGKNLSPAAAREFIDSISDVSIENPDSFEQQALRFVGRDIYEAFFKGYTTKQWGMSPQLLPASILKRLPLRYNYDDNYFSHKYQAIPREGYTALVEKMLDVKNVSVFLNTKFSPQEKKNFDHVFYSGPLDAWFGYEGGRLPYRTLDFEVFRDRGDYQGNAVINYCDEDIPYTRITEHKHFSPWEEHELTVCFREYSRSCGESDIPYYPVRLANSSGELEKYEELASREKNVTFVGRLGTYRYMDMDVTIGEALNVADRFCRS